MAGKRRKADPDAHGRHSRKRKLGVGKPRGAAATWWNEPVSRAFFRAFDGAKA